MIEPSSVTLNLRDQAEYLRYLKHVRSWRPLKAFNRKFVVQSCESNRDEHMLWNFTVRLIELVEITKA